MVKKEIELEVDLTNTLCDDTLLSPNSVEEQKQNNINKHEHGRASVSNKDKLDGLEKARELLTNILNQLMYLDYPLNNNDTTEIPKGEGDDNNDVIDCNNTLNDNVMNMSSPPSINNTRLMPCSQTHNKAIELKAYYPNEITTTDTASVHSTMASTRTSDIPTTTSTNKDKVSNDNGINKMGHTSLVDLCANAIESSIVIKPPPALPPTPDPTPIFNEIESNHPSDEEELELEPETGLLCNMQFDLHVPTLESLFSKKVFEQNSLFCKTPAAAANSPESKNSLANIQKEETSISNIHSFELNPSSSFSTINNDTTTNQNEHKQRTHMFGSEYGRFLSTNNPFQIPPIRPEKKKNTISKFKRFTRDIYSNTRTPPRPTIGSVNIEDTSNHMLTGAITDVIITHDNEHPPRGFYRISKTSMGHDADLTALAGDTSIYLNVKKEVHWDRAVQRPYITAITIIFPDRQEFVPPGYCVVRHFIDTKDKLDSTSEPANLNYAIKSTERIYLCFKRSRDGNPITGIVPLQPSNNEIIPEGYTVIERTPRNFIADVNSSTNGPPIFLAIRQRLANLETLRPIPLLAACNTTNKMSAYYATGGTIIHSSKLGNCHVMDRSRHPMISPSSVVQRLLLIQESRHIQTSPITISSPPTLQNYPAYDTVYHSVSSSINDCESIESLSSNLLIQSMVSDYIGRSLSATTSNHDSFSNASINNTIPLYSNTPYVDTRSPNLEFIPIIITNVSSDDGDTPADLVRVLILTPILTCCYTHHGGVARVAIESLSYLFNHTDFFDKDAPTNSKKKSSENHTLLDLAVQVTCDVSTSTCRETMFQSCVDFVFDALRFTNGNLSTRSLGYSFRMFLFVFYFGASMPKSSSSWPFFAKELLMEESHERDIIGAPQAAALALKNMVTILLSRLDYLPINDEQEQQDTNFQPSQKKDIYLLVQNIVTELVDSAISTVDVTNFTQIAIHQIQRSGGSELFWHEMITSCGHGLFGKHNHEYVVAFAILASIVKISSGSIRSIQHTGESIPRDVNTKLLSLELLCHFVRNCKIGLCDNQAPFHSSPAFILAYTIRRLLVPCLINNTVSSIDDPRIFRRILSIITELWTNFRFHLKVEIAVLLDHFLIRILKVGPQTTGTSKKKCITLDHQLEVLSKVSIWFANDPIDILELYLNYDMDDSKGAGVLNWKVWQLLCNCLCNFAEQCGIVIAEQIHCTRENQKHQIEVEDVADVQRKREAARSLQAKSLEAICKIVRCLLEASYQVVNEDFSLFDSLTKNDSLFFGVNSSSATESFHSSKNANNIYLQRTISHRSSNGLKEKQADKKKTEESMKVAFEILEDRGLKKALDYLVACNVVTPSPRDLASFLRVHQSRLDPSILGEYLGEGGRADDGELFNLIRYHFIRAISFAAMNVEEGLRHLLSRCGVMLPGEAQKIDRILSTFAQCYWEDNAGDHVKCPFRHQDTVYLLSYAIIMLNTDLHKANGAHSSNVSATSSTQTRSLSRKRQPKRMSTQDFITNLRGTDADDLCKDYLTSIYESIERNPIKFLSIHKTHAPKPNKDQNNQNSVLSYSSSICFSSDRSYSTSSTSSVRLLTKSIKPSLELLRGLADQKHIFYSSHDDDSLHSKEFLKLIVQSVWHHFYGIVNGTLDAVQLDPQGVFACLQILQNTICITIILGMKTEKKAFINQLARIKFLMERGLEDGASRVYSRSVKEANFVVGDEFKHERWYEQMEKLCTSTNPMDAVRTVVRAVEQLKHAMPIDGTVNVAMKKVTDLIRNGGILLNNPTRSFVYDGALTKKSSRSGRSTVYRFFLFSDVLLYAHKSSKGDYKVHESLLLHMMKISDIEVSKKHPPHGFQIHHPRKSFVAFATSLEVKKMWLDLLTSGIRRAVERKAGFEGAPLAVSASCES